MIYFSLRKNLIPLQKKKQQQQQQQQQKLAFYVLFVYRILDRCMVYKKLALYEIFFYRILVRYIFCAV